MKTWYWAYIDILGRVFIKNYWNNMIDIDDALFDQNIIKIFPPFKAYNKQNAEEIIIRHDDKQDNESIVN